MPSRWASRFDSDGLGLSGTWCSWLARYRDMVEVAGSNPVVPTDLGLPPHLAWEMDMPKLALFDMDGTLFDHDARVREDMLSIAAPGEDLEEFLDPVNLRELIESRSYMKARFDLIRSQPGWWENLPRFQPGFQVYYEAVRIGFCCHILTKGPTSQPLAWAEKVKCIHHHFGEDMPIDIVGRDKSGRYGRVLVDDYPPYVLGWLEHRPRGLAIVPAGPVNVGFEHPNAIRYDGGNLDEVKRHMRAAFDRQERRHWREFLK